MTSDLVSNTATEIRDNLVTTAVKFLTNPKIQNCTLERKQQFLRSKGLTDIEISKAMEKCAELLDVPSMTSELMLYHQARRSWFRENVLPFIIYGGFIYGCYWFYNKCIRRLIFVEQPKKKTTEDCINEVRKSLDVLNANIVSLRGDMQASAQHTTLRIQLDSIKSEIASVKGILLSRNQFATVKIRSEPTSIPEWQKQAAVATSKAKPNEKTEGSEEKEPESLRNNSESEGSNSSDGEQATKNSDSSLEIIT